MSILDNAGHDPLGFGNIPQLEKRRIVAAAVQQGDLIVSMVRPHRHHHILRRMAGIGVDTPISGEQGFLTSDGMFVDRYLAMRIAIEAKQLIPREGQHGPSGQLFSEDLW